MRREKRDNRMIYCYEAFDEYEGAKESLGKFRTKAEAKKACRRREADTDGECNCYVEDMATGERI